MSDGAAASTIPDPAQLLAAPGWLSAMHHRYSGAIASIPADPHPELPREDYPEVYSKVCDVLVQILWAERFGVSPDDPEMHTSHEARALASLILRAAGMPHPLEEEIEQEIKQDLLDLANGDTDTGRPTAP